MKNKIQLLLMCILSQIEDLFNNKLLFSFNEDDFQRSFRHP